MTKRVFDTTNHGDCIAAVQHYTAANMALTDALLVAIEALEEFYGSDESETIDHLRSTFKAYGA